MGGAPGMERDREQDWEQIWCPKPLEQGCPCSRDGSLSCPSLTLAQLSHPPSWCSCPVVVTACFYPRDSSPSGV